VAVALTVENFSTSAQCLCEGFARRHWRLQVAPEPAPTSPIRSGASAMSKLILLLTLSLVVAAHARADVKVEKIEYKGWRNCYQVSNGEVALVVTSDVGPRVISFGFVGGQNLF
jgi:hypothetical protein